MGATEIQMSFDIALPMALNEKLIILKFILKSLFIFKYLF